MSHQMEPQSPAAFAGDGESGHEGPRRGMNVEGLIFVVLTVFFFVAAAIYWLWSNEWSGTVALALSGGLTLIIGTFMRFTGRRLDGPRPEDRNAEIAEGAGELGFFSPGSYWPVTLAATAAFSAIAIAFWLVWMLIIAGSLLIMSVCGLLFEYHKGPAAH